MKNVFTIIAILFLAISLQSQSVENTRYVIFDGMEFAYDYYKDQGPIAHDVIDTYYYQPLKTHPRYANYTKRLEFSNSTFSTYDVKNFDLAIFPVGDYGLDAQVNGVVILDKIREMLDAGKKVIIIGSHIFRNTKSTEGRYLLEKELALSFDKAQPLTTTSGSTTTFKGMRTKGVAGDPIGLHESFTKVFNISYGIAGEPPMPPLRMLSEVEGFQVKPESKAKFFSSIIGNDGSQDEAYIKMPEGLRVGAYLTMKAVPTGTPKIVFWSIPHDFISTFYTSNMTREYTRAVDWLMEGVPYPERFCELIPDELDFEFVTPLTTKELPLIIQNFGRTDLTVTDIKLDKPGEGIYTFKDKNLPVTLPPLGEHTIMVEFAPQEQRAYVETYKVESNGINSPKIGVLRGSGVEDAQGAKLYMERDTLRYGSVVLGNVKDYEIVVRNVGTVGMSLTKFETLRNDGEVFKIPQVFSTPINIPSGETTVIPMRFIPIEKKEYKASFYIQTNALNYLHDAEQKGLNRGEWIVNMVGRGVEKGADPKITSGQEVLDFGAVEGEATLAINITNIGGTTLKVFSIEKTGSAEAKKQFDVVDNPSFQTPIEILVGKSHNVDVKFTPADKKLYETNLTFLSNGGNLDVLVKGEGASAGPKIEIRNNVFYFSDIASNTSISLENIGDKLLQVSKVYIEGDDSENFEFLYNEAEPFAEPGEALPIQVYFISNGVKKNFEATLVIESNANGQEKLEIDLRAILVSVDDSQYEIEGGEFTVEVMPNPITNFAEFKVSNSGNVSVSADIFVADITGRRVVDINTNVFMPGHQSFAFDASALSNGLYYLIAEVEGNLVTMPFIVNR